jgi:hypothetical protein
MSRIPYRSAFPAVGGMLALLVYVGIAWFVFPPHAFFTPDEGAKLLQLQSLRWENGHLGYDIAYPGRDLDPDLQFAQNDPLWGFLRVRDNKLYFQRLPVFPLLVLPFFRWFGFQGLYLLPAVGGAVSGVLALHLLERDDRRFGMWMLIAFGSPVFIYATIFWEHTLTTCLGLVGAWLAFRIGPIARAAPPPKIAGWLLVGAVLGTCVYIRLEMLIFALALLLACWCIVRDGRWGPMWAGASLGLVLLPYRLLHGIMFGGHQMPDHADYLFNPLRYLVSAQWRAVPDLLIGPPIEDAIHTGWLGGLWAIAAVIVVAHSFSATDSLAMRRIRLAGLATTAVVGALFLFHSTLYHSAHGLLFTTPWALLGLSRARQVWRSGSWRARVVVLTAVLGLVGYALAMVGLRGAPPQGGLEWGARFAMPFYPLLALIAAWDLGARRCDVKTLAIVGALVFLGLGFQARGIWTIGRDKQTNAALYRMIVEVPERHIVTDMWWLPLNAAPVYAQKDVFVIDTPEELGIWVARAVAQQVLYFSLVTENDRLLHDAIPIIGGHRLTVVEAGHMGDFLILRVAIEPK